MIAANISGDSSRLCAIPKPYLDLCTKRVLVMEELKGNKLVVELKKDMERQMGRINNSLEKFGDEKKMESSFLKEFALGENGPSAKEYDTLIGLLDAKRRMSNLLASLYNVSVGWIPGVQKKSYESKSSLPINHAKLIDDLLYIHGHQVAKDPFRHLASFCQSLFLTMFGCSVFGSIRYLWMDASMETLTQEISFFLA